MLMASLLPDCQVCRTAEPMSMLLYACIAFCQARVVLHCHRRKDIHSLRDLNAEHLPLLTNIKHQACKVCQRWLKCTACTQRQCAPDIDLCNAY